VNQLLPPNAVPGDKIMIVTGNARCRSPFHGRSLPVLAVALGSRTRTGRTGCGVFLPADPVLLRKFAKEVI